jgi:hypothetical protein
MSLSRPHLYAAGFCLAVSAACATGFRLSPAHLDEQGVLIEQFALIPLAWFFGSVGAGLLLLAWARRK